MNASILLLCAGLAFGQGQTVLRGTVKETIAAGPYTYILVTTPDGDKWAAVNKVTLKTGAKVSVVQDMVMDNFESPSLHRKFDHVVFGVLEGKGTEKAPKNPHSGLKPMAPTAGGPVKSVAKSEAPDGRTIAELFALKSDLKGRSVSVRGQVVKYNPQIMGSNWLHLRDGSGTDKGKDNDITVTTQDAAKVGDIVTTRGIVGLDKDFGAGYFYTVIVEKASLSR